MSLNNKKPTPDIENIEHHDSSGSKKIVLYGKTTGNTFVPIQVNDDGSFK